MAEYTAGENITFSYEVKNAAGNRGRLPELAKDIIAGKPDMAIAAGGIEADALKAASAGSGVPGVFLSISSSVDRGIVEA